MTNDQFRAVVEAAAKVVEGTRQCSGHFCVADLRWAKAIRSLRPSDCGVRVSETQGWIPVTQRLPDMEGHYLVFDIVVKMGLFQTNTEGEGWWNDWADVGPDFTADTIQPTHWQPLPPPPPAPAEDHDASDYGPSVLGERKGEG